MNEDTGNTLEYDPNETDPYRQQVVVVFREDVALPYLDNVENHIKQRRIAPWDQLIAQFPNISMRRMYPALTPERFEDLNKRIVERTPDFTPYNFLRVFFISCPLEMDAKELAKSLSRWSIVEEAYVASRFVPASVVNPGLNPEYVNQKYLEAAPLGIDAVYAWTHAGGDGEGVQGADIEAWYQADHEDLVGQGIYLYPANAQYPNFTTSSRIDHGTKSLGIICASHNNIGVIGITPNIDNFYFLPWQWDPMTTQHFAAQILEVGLNLYSIHVLLIECQGEDLGLQQLPVEVDSQVRNAISTITALGVTVVEPAGNGNVDLDHYAYIDANGASHYILNRNSADFIDSGAVMVGACTSTLPHIRSEWAPVNGMASGSNFGSRIDCFAWGDHVRSCQLYPWLGHSGRYGDFSGTSSASAIIAGAALSLQGIARAKGSNLNALSMRNSLSSLTMGTPVYFIPGGPQHGVMPNLRRIIDEAGIAGPTITLLTPEVHFVGGAYQGQVVWQAASFNVNCLQAYHLGIKPGEGPSPPFVALPTYTPYPSVIIGPTNGETITVRLWFSFTTPPVQGNVPYQHITIYCPETGQEFQVLLTATVPVLPYIASLLVLDRSTSMLSLAGSTGISKIAALRDAVRAFITLMPPEFTDSGGTYGGNELGILTFAKDAWLGKEILYLDAGGNATYELDSFVAAIQPVNTFGPCTALGKALQMAKRTLDNASLNPDYEYTKSIVFFTDGIENIEPYVSEVKDSIDYKTYAIGLGTETQVSTAALTNLSESVGGYCLLTGELTTDTEDFFRLTKYFMQILTDLTAQDVTADPSGTIMPEQLIRIPFTLSDDDFRAEVVLLMDIPIVSLELESPDGTVFSENAPGISFGVGHNLRYCRLVFPLPLSEGIHAGTWYARLSITAGEVSEETPLGTTNIEGPVSFRRAARYSLNVHTRSNIQLNAQLQQRSFLPGEPFLLRAVPTEFTVPMNERIRIKSIIRRPDKTKMELELLQTEPGVYETLVPTPIQGVYHVRLLASGHTHGGYRFTREKRFTAAVWRGGDQPLPTGKPTPWCMRWICGFMAAIVILLFALVLTILLF